MVARRGMWIGLAVVGAVAVAGGLVWLFRSLGAEEADRISSGIGAGAALIGLILTVLGLINARPQAIPDTTQQLPRPNATGPEGLHSPSQRVDNSTIMGPNIQVGGSLTGGVSAQGSGQTAPAVNQERDL